MTVTDIEAVVRHVAAGGIVAVVDDGRDPPDVDLVTAGFTLTEATLAEELNSIASLRANPRVNSYLKWVRKQKSAGGFKVRRANNRR